jgi:hypothetical protein
MKEKHEGKEARDRGWQELALGVNGVIAVAVRQ